MNGSMRFLFGLAVALLAAACTDGSAQPGATLAPGLSTPDGATSLSTPPASGQTGVARTSTVPSGAATGAASQTGSIASGASSARGATLATPEPAPLPASTTKYDPWQPVKVGDAVELAASGLVVQVTGAKTIDFEPDRDLLLVDLVIANRGNASRSINSLLHMHAVTGDWRWYGATLPEMAKAGPALASAGVRLFDSDLAPGEARKGAAAIPVPRNAQQLALAFVPPGSSTSPESNPILYVPLGIRGDFPPLLIAEDARAAARGTMYGMGQAVRAPSREVTVMVNGVRERTESTPDLAIQDDEKLVIVDVTIGLLGDAKPLDPREVAVVDAGGSYLMRFLGEDFAINQAEQSRVYSAAARRGMLVFVARRGSAGFSLRITPADPGSTQGRVTHLVDETMVFDLGGAPALPTIAPIVPTATRTATPVRTTPTPRPPVPTATPRPPARATPTREVPPPSRGGSGG